MNFGTHYYLAHHYWSSRSTFIFELTLPRARFRWKISNYEFESQSIFYLYFSIFFAFSKQCGNILFTGPIGPKMHSKWCRQYIPLILVENGNSSLISAFPTSSANIVSAILISNQNGWNFLWVMSGHHTIGFWLYIIVSSILQFFGPP